MQTSAPPANWRCGAWRRGKALPKRGAGRRHAANAAPMESHEPRFADALENWKANNITLAQTVLLEARIHGGNAHDAVSAGTAIWRWRCCEPGRDAFRATNGVIATRGGRVVMAHPPRKVEHSEHSGTFGSNYDWWVGSEQRAL